MAGSSQGSAGGRMRESRSDKAGSVTLPRRHVLHRGLSGSPAPLTLVSSGDLRRCQAAIMLKYNNGSHYAPAQGRRFHHACRSPGRS